ncbi:hypothetical protein XELAEV_18002482mg [Xenopus laevis]|nr:hypothetical protein XELAEV_18002482mg [Xenopus laevis]
MVQVEKQGRLEWDGAGGEAGQTGVGWSRWRSRTDWSGMEQVEKQDRLKQDGADGEQDRLEWDEQVEKQGRLEWDGVGGEAGQTGVGWSRWRSRTDWSGMELVKKQGRLERDGAGGEAGQIGVGWNWARIRYSPNLTRRIGGFGRIQTSGFGASLLEIQWNLTVTELDWELGLGRESFLGSTKHYRK